MREPERIERITNLINDIWKQYPYLRFMQLIDMIQRRYSRINGNNSDWMYTKFESEHAIVFQKDIPLMDMFYVEDDELEKFLEGLSEI